MGRTVYLRQIHGLVRRGVIPCGMSTTHSDSRVSDTTRRFIASAERSAAKNYNPLPVVLSSAEGAWATDVDGRRYFDALAGYSAMNFGHANPRLVARATEQLQRLTLTARAFHNDQFNGFAEALTRLTGKDKMLPMNSGAEAVETAIKLSRRWAYQVKGVPADEAVIITMRGNFHGRTTTIVSYSDDPEARVGYGPFTPGFRNVPYGDAAALAAALEEEGPNVAAVLMEPIQGEAGVIIPPEGFLREVRELTSKHGVLMVADEVQSGLARTGTTFAVEHEQVVPDVYILGKALGGGLYPVSAIAADAEIMDVFTPGTHGSTFGGNPLASAIATEVVSMLEEGTYQQNARRMGARMEAGLQSLVGQGIVGLRIRGAWAGVDVDPSLMTGREACEAMLERGVLVKDTHGSTIRLSPPLVASDEDIDFMLEALESSLQR